MSATKTLTKRCSKCGARKALSSFRADPRTRTGRRTQCRACDVAYSMKYNARLRRLAELALRAGLDVA